MDDQLGPLDIGEEALGHLGKPWLIAQEFGGDAMHVRGAGLDLTIGLEILVKVVTGQTTIDQLDAPDLDDAVPLKRVETGRLGIQHELSHRTIS